jgi:sortase A
MLLKMGVVMMLLSLMLAAGVAAIAAFRNEAPETATAVARSAPEKPAVEERKFDPGQKLEINDNSDKRPPSEKLSSKEPSPKEPSSKKPVSKESASESSSAPAPQAEPVPDWPQPTSTDIASANAPRYYQRTSDMDMTLTIEALGLYNIPVTNSHDLRVLDSGLMHDPETSLPWTPLSQGRNVFIAGHYLGWPGTASHLVFYNLDKLQSGDKVMLEDRQGRVYAYRVSESFKTTPEDSWVMGQEVGRDMLTLQTCIPPTFEERLIVQADRA